jgi:hypothetical protein
MPLPPSHRKQNGCHNCAHHLEDDYAELYCTLTNLSLWQLNELFTSDEAIWKEQSKEYAVDYEDICDEWTHQDS